MAVAVQERPYGVDQTAQLVRLAHEDKRQEVGRAVLAFDNAGILVIDKNGLCLDANATACRLLGNPRARLVGSELCEMIPGTDKDVPRAIGLRLSAGKSYSGDMVLLRPNGDPFLAAVRIIANVGQGVHLGVIAHLSDHHQLCQQSSILQRAQMLNLGAWAWTPETDQWWWSDALYSIYGVSPDDGPPGSNWLENVHQDDRIRVSDAMGAVAAGEPVEIEYRILSSSERKTRWIRAKARRERGAPGCPGRVLGAVVDITRERTADPV